MKKLCLLLALLLALSGCADPDHTAYITVVIEETEGCAVEANGLRILPGEDAVFALTLDPGLGLAGTDYDGVTRTRTQGQVTTLTLEDVRYPTRIRLRLSHSNTQITYHANGGLPLSGGEEAVTVSYSLLKHLRPNTDTGTGLFAREGHTLLCWNTRPDGSGTEVGLGSRVTVSASHMELYAQWVEWSDPKDFSYTAGDAAVTVTGYTGTDELLVIPETLGGLPVTAIAAGAFQNCAARTVVLPKSLQTLEEGAFQSCAMTELVLFDRIETFSDASFSGCGSLQTLRINAIEAPFGYLYRKESCYADKVDLLIQAQGQRKLVFYGGCSTWFNLDGPLARQTFGDAYTVINMGLNGTVNSLVQMQILGAYLQEGDVLLHTPELSSGQQLLTNTDLLDTDKSLWSGIENNYDLLRHVDLQTVGGVFDSLCSYLQRKDRQTSYTEVYTDELDREYMDVSGCIPFYRNTTKETLGDSVYLDPARIDEGSLARLCQVYDWYESLGVRVYLSHACVNMDAVEEGQRENLHAVEQALKAGLEAAGGPALISSIDDFVYGNQDFYDTNYHLRSEQARKNTEIWLRDLTARMESDGLWKEGTP